MIVRLVEMTFRTEAIGEFQQHFEGWRHRIRGFPGCQHLQLLHDASDPRVFFTYSHWDGPEDLEAYRNSDVFAEVWPVTKALFAEPAEAWSVMQEYRM